MPAASGLSSWTQQIRLGFDALSGRLERSAETLARRIDWSACADGRRTILCLDRALFRKDLAEMSRRTSFNFATVSAAAVKRCQEPWVPEQLRKQTYFAHYLDTVLARAKPGLVEFAVKFLLARSHARKIDAVMAGNTDYWQEEAIKLACRQIGIPFIALCRENYVWERDAVIVRDRFRNSGFVFAGTSVAVASAITRRSLVESGAFDPSCVFVTGAPRFDPWVDRIGLKPTGDRETITLLSYAEPIYLAPRCFKDTLSAFVDVALAATDAGLRFVIKVKKSNEIGDVTRLDPRILGSNIEVTDSAHLPDLFNRSRVIIGYNSLAVLEGLLSEVRVVVPWWADAVRSEDECLMHASRPEDVEVADFPVSPEELRYLIAMATKAPIPAKTNRRALFERFSKQSFLSVDRTSSAAVADVIDWSIERAAHVQQAG